MNNQKQNLARHGTTSNPDSYENNTQIIFYQQIGLRFDNAD